MNFDEDNKVIIDTMNRDEAKVFIKFLHSEILRHEGDIDDAFHLIDFVEKRFNLVD